MGFLDRLLGRSASAAETKSSGGVPSQGFLPTLGSTPAASGALINQATALSVSAVYACVSIVAEDVARCAPSLYRKLGAAGREKVTKHPVAKLFRKPNRIQTWFEFSEQMEVALRLRGNAYAVALRDSRGNPTELIPVNPDAVLVLEASDGSIFYNVNRIGLFQMAVLRDFPISIPAEDVFHLRGIAFNAIVAASRIGFARDAIGLAIGLEEQASRWMSNGARPGVFLKTAKKLTEETGKRLKKAWNETFGGVRNTGSTVILEEGLEAQALQLTSVDLEFLAQRNLQVEEIGRFWRVPPHKLGISTKATIANQAAADQDYVNNTIMPDLERWEQKVMDFFDLDPDEYEVDFDEEKLLRADLMTRLNAGRLGIMTGIYKVNEVRAGENREPIEGGDVAYRPMNMAVLGSDMAGVAPDGNGRPESGTIPAGGVSTGGDLPKIDDGGAANEGGESNDRAA